MRIPKSEFTDADMKLCRAHGASVAQGRVMTASQPHDDAEWSRLWDRAEAIATFETAICVPDDLPLPPDYWSELERWTKTLAPEKPAATRPEPAAGVWNREDPPAPGVYVACHDFQDQRPQHYAHWSGMDWTITYNKPDSAMEGRRRGMISNARDYLWLRLIEADAPAARLDSTSSAAELQHLVCVVTTGSGTVGYVRAFASHQAALREMQDKVPGADYRLCDKDGFIPHTPTADSVCPVPDGVHFETLLFGGGRPLDGGYGGTGDCNCIKWDAGTSVIAWRPIARDAS